MIDLEAIEKLLAEATPAAWRLSQDGNLLGPPGVGYLVVAATRSNSSEARGNSAAIVSLRNAAPTLLALARAGRRLAEAVSHAWEVETMESADEATAAIAAFREADA